MKGKRKYIREVRLVKLGYEEMALEGKVGTREGRESVANRERMFN